MTLQQLSLAIPLARLQDKLPVAGNDDRVCCWASCIAATHDTAQALHGSMGIAHWPLLTQTQQYSMPCFARALTEQ